jgi:Arc/MetJ-type ribon-helix-helix transcriptional regulator
MAEKLLQARVDERTAMRLWAYAEAMPGEPGKTNKSNKKKKMSESELVKHAIDLVIAESDRQLVALQRKIRADAEQTAQALSGDMPAPSRPASALQLGKQVPPGGKTFQAKVPQDKADRLHAFGRAYRASDSELIRRGFKLILEEAMHNKEQLLQQLRADYEATAAALVGDFDLADVGGPDIPEQPVGDHQHPGSPDGLDGDVAKTDEKSGSLPASASGSPKKR